MTIFTEISFIISVLAVDVELYATPVMGIWGWW